MLTFFFIIFVAFLFQIHTEMKQTTLHNISDCSLKYEEINVEMRKFQFYRGIQVFDKQ